MAGPLLLKPHIFEDARGFFYESWNADRFNQLLQANGQQPCRFVQDNHSSSSKGVLRGLHFQKSPHPQAKLVRCVVGEIFDVAVDLRSNSGTFGCWVGARLSAANCCQLWIPEGFAHGFLTLSERAEVLYKASDFWHAECERSLRWDDPDVCVQWPDLTTPTQPLLSPKDAAADTLSCLAAAHASGLFA
jgi:dTDP-4-dehydrorhamnose 3,5-epimerase